MSYIDNDPVKIGSNVRTGGGGGPREKVLRSTAEINAAKRAGNVSVEAKPFLSSTKSGQDGARLAKIDRSEDIIKPPTVGKEVGQAISDQRQKMTPKWSQKDLAGKCNMTVAEISAYERGTAAPDQSQLSKMERHLGIKLRGTGIGGPLKTPKSKENPPKKK